MSSRSVHQFLLAGRGKPIESEKKRGMEKMDSALNIVKMVATLVAAIMVGNWFVAEVRSAKVKGLPWYRPYLSVPGAIIVLFIVMPIVLWVVAR